MARGRRDESRGPADLVLQTPEFAGKSVRPANAAHELRMKNADESERKGEFVSLAPQPQRTCVVGHLPLSVSGIAGIPRGLRVEFEEHLLFRLGVGPLETR